MLPLRFPNSREFARRFVKGIGKLAGSTKGDRREEDRRTCHENVGGYRIMREIRVTASSFRRVNRPYHRMQLSIFSGMLDFGSGLKPIWGL
ncbi:hypothetical protein B296_00058809 [Ensete ventricosum]|uniref:Uncharacterized protein n=1 Tax=Ensete ventricosum TaxID=4639 RepID=A0A426XDS6_ENSVE|nr:hypothetical protein B296_00058809 [Ensete ventricosum]